MKKKYLVFLLFFVILYLFTTIYGQQSSPYTLDTYGLYQQDIATKLCDNLIIVGKPKISGNYVSSSDELTLWLKKYNKFNNTSYVVLEKWDGVDWGHQYFLCYLIPSEKYAAYKPFVNKNLQVDCTLGIKQIPETRNWEEWSIIRPLSQSQDIKIYISIDSKNPNILYLKGGYYNSQNSTDIKYTKTADGNFKSEWKTNTGSWHTTYLSFASQDKINLVDSYVSWGINYSDSDKGIRVNSPNYKQLVKDNIPAESNAPTVGELVSGTLRTVSKVMGNKSSSSSDDESSSSSSNSSSNSKKCIFYVDTEKVHKGSIHFDYGYEFTIFDNEGDKVQAYFDYRKSGEHLSNNNDPWYADGYWVETKDLAIKKIMKSKGCPNFEIKKGKLDD